MTKFIRVTHLGSKPNRAGYLPFSQATVWRMMKADPTFPKPFSLSARVVVVECAAVDGWLEMKRGGSHA